MDILRFINSKDIREHLRSIRYEFNSLETAWLIYQCHDATIDEKHKAWNELIETMPDCPIEKRLNTVAQDSLHAFLRLYMTLEDKYMNEFCDERHADTFNDDKPFVYKFKYIYEDGTENGWDTVFSCLNALYESIMEPEEDVTSIQCTKMQIDRLESRQIAYLNSSFEFLRLDPGRIDSDKEWDLFGGVFDGLWFEFPTPFQKGDIVWNPDQPEGFCAGPFVTTGVCLDGINGGLDCLFHALAHDHGVCAGGNVLQTFVDNRLRQKRRGRRAVAGNVVGLGCDLAHELRAHVLKCVFELNVLCDRDAVVGDQRSAVFLAENHIAALRTHCNLYRIGKLVNAGQQRLACVLAVNDLFCHNINLPFCEAFNQSQSTIARISASLQIT